MLNQRDQVLVTLVFGGATGLTLTAVVYAIFIGAAPVHIGPLRLYACNGLIAAAVGAIWELAWLWEERTPRLAPLGPKNNFLVVPAVAGGLIGSFVIRLLWFVTNS